MKANEVMRTLRISRGTLGNYIKSGKLVGKKMPNGHYDYDETVVYALVLNVVCFNLTKAF